MPLQGRPLLSHVLERIAPQVSSIVINSNSDPALFQAFGLPVRPDDMPGRPGPLAGLLTGLTWARELCASHLLTVPCDTPFLPRNLVQRLSEDLCGSGADIAVARDMERLHPVIALWPLAIATRLAHDLQAGARSIHRWLGQFQLHESEFPSAHFVNLNTPGELKSARRRIEFR